MSLIPEPIGRRWQRRSYRQNVNKLQNLLEFRELVPDYKAEGVLMQAYAEAAVKMTCAESTLRDDMSTIREYPSEKLHYWITNKLSFDHIKTANRLAETAKRTPEWLLDFCIDPGNEVGEQLTVAELEAFCIAELPQSKRTIAQKIAKLLDEIKSVIVKADWDDKKQERFTQWWGAGEEFRR